MPGTTGEASKQGVVLASTLLGELTRGPTVLSLAADLHAYLRVRSIR